MECFSKFGDIREVSLCQDLSKQSVVFSDMELAPDSMKCLSPVGTERLGDVVLSSFNSIDEFFTPLAPASRIAGIPVPEKSECRAIWSESSTTPERRGV